MSRTVTLTMVLEIDEDSVPTTESGEEDWLEFINMHHNPGDADLIKAKVVQGKKVLIDV